MVLKVKMVTKASKQSIYPSRGLLVTYSAKGCPLHEEIAEGVFQKHNESLAYLQCNPGHVLQSTLETSSTSHCSGPPLWKWEPKIYHCVSLQFLLQYANKSVTEAISAKFLRLKQDNR